MLQFYRFGFYFRRVLHQESAEETTAGRNALTPLLNHCVHCLAPSFVICVHSIAYLLLFYI